HPLSSRTITLTPDATLYRSTSQTVTATIHGANDAAVIAGTSTGSVIEAGGVNNGTLGTPTASGTLTASDVDNTPNTFQAATGSTERNSTRLNSSHVEIFYPV